MNRTLNKAGALLLLYLGVFPQIYLIAETLDCKVDPSLFFWVAGLGALVWFAACFRNGLLIGMPLSALALYAAYRSYDANPSVQLVDLFDRITGVYYEHFYAPGSSYTFNSAVESHSLLLVFLAFLLASYIAASLTSRWGRIPLSLLGSLPIMCACLSVNGTPSSPIMLSYVLFVILLLVTGSSYIEDSGTGCTLFSAVLPVTILLCVLLLIYDPARYEINERDILLSQQVDRISVLLSRWFGNSAGTDDSYSEFGIVSDQSGANSGPLEPSLLNGWGSAAGPMDLTRSFDFAALDDPVLSARADTDGTVYLRMSSYGDYSGTAWQIADDPPTASSLPLTALAIEDQSDTQRHSMILQVKTTLPYSCVPYYCLREDASDSFLMEDGPGQQKVLYFSYPGDLMHLAVPGEYESRERDYRAFAHQYYTRLPDETASVMRQLSSAAGLDASDPDIVQTVAKYVQNAGTYDLLTEPYPSNDYAVWFLTEAHRGYCIHFATAAAVLYRSLGIPARVTLGYLLDARSDAEVEVSAADAHAWVEVYADGLGWLPVEVTGQNDARDHSSDNAGEMGLEKTEAPGDMASDASGEGSDAPTAETAEGNETETPGSEQLPVGIVPGANPSDGKQNKDNTTARNRILLIVIPILLVSILPLRRLTARALLKRAYHQEDHRKAAVAVYRSAVYIGKLGASIPEQIEITAEKARFSNHEITEEEINENLILLEETTRTLYSQLKPLNKLQLKYWKGLL